MARAPSNRAAANKEYNTFVQGLITEASPLTYPENASIDEENFVLNRNGSRRRRQGMDYESGYSLSSSILNDYFSDQSVTIHKWSNADNNGLYQMAVVQVGATLHFYDITASSISANKKSFTVDLNTFKTAYAINLGANPISTASGYGYLIVVSKDTEPFYIEYDVDTDTITTTQISLEIRDFIGVDDGLDIDENPTTLSSEHEYNLKNQGWLSSHITTYFSTGVYPDNTQTWILGKDSSDNFSAALLNKQSLGNTPAPKGHYIFDAFTRDRATTSEISGLSTEIEQNRPSATAFYAGRIWYSGIVSKRTAGPALNGYIFYSQILEDISKVGKCYQESDPTSEYTSDLLPTDGGYIVLPEVGEILHMEVLRNSLVVFADNGVWQIHGDTDAGFTADAYQITKITKIGAAGRRSIVIAEDVILYWADGGIYTLKPEQISQKLIPQNITQTTIQTLYNNISSVSRKYVVGNYDPINRRISWLYNGDSSYSGSTYRNKYDTELVLDTTLTAFYKNTISSLTSYSPYVAGYITTPDLITADISYNVVVGDVQVQVDTVDTQVSLPSPSLGSSSTKYLVVVPQSDNTNSKLTFGLYTNTSFYDWVTADSTGVDYTSYLITGYELLGDSMRDKQATYLHLHFTRTETGFITSGSNLVLENPSSCKFQSRWEFSDSTNSGRWSDQFQGYRFNRIYVPSGAGDTFDYGFSVISTKNKLRGKGKALSLYFTSEPGYDCEILGWAINYTGVKSA